MLLEANENPGSNTFSINEIVEHGEGLLKPAEPKPHAEIFEVILGAIERVNFRELTKYDTEEQESKSLKQKHYLICVVDQLLKITKQVKYEIILYNGTICLYNGAYWSSITENDWKRFLGKAAHKMGVDKFDARFHMFKENLYKQFLSDVGTFLTSNPSDTSLINLKNGTLEITESGVKLREFRPKDFLTYQLNFEYDPGASRSRFNTYLNRVISDKDTQNVLAEFMGYVFTKGLKLEKCLLLYGSGANGKSVFYDIMNALLGKNNVSNCSLGDLAKECNRAMIANKLLNYGSELKGSIESDVFKTLASGESIVACKKYCDPFLMESYAKLCFNCNDLPRDVEHNEAFFRRFIVIPFLVTIPESERNPNLASSIIKSELPGILNWVLDGLSRLISQKRFTESRAIQKQLMQFKVDSDSVLLFLNEEGYIKSLDGRLLIKDLYQDYKQFCDQDNFKPVSKTNFKKRLESAGFRVERIGIGNVVNLRKNTFL